MDYAMKLNWLEAKLQELYFAGKVATHSTWVRLRLEARLAVWSYTRWPPLLRAALIDLCETDLCVGRQVYAQKLRRVLRLVRFYKT